LRILIHFEVAYKKSFERRFNFAVHVTVFCLPPAQPKISVVHMTVKLEASDSTSQ
jgi:hypothetical protein